MSFKLLFEDEHLVMIDKPSGMHVHKPEDPRIPGRDLPNCLELLREQTGRYLYPVHRLDFATSGVLMFAYSKEAARSLNEMFQGRKIEKTYYCVVRGWTPDTFVENRPLSSESGPERKIDAETRFERDSMAELKTQVGRYPSARYSLVKAYPKTGRRHQIRRHLAGLSHPIVGDVRHGDRHHNHFFRDELKIESLLLRAHSLELDHPIVSGTRLHVEGGWDEKWRGIFELFRNFRAEAPAS